MMIFCEAIYCSELDEILADFSSRFLKEPDQKKYFTLLRYLK